MKKWLACLLLLTLLAPCALASEDGAETITLSFIGDCSMGEMYSTNDKEGTFTDTMDKQGLDWPFMNVRDILEKDDFTFANNEIIYTTRSKQRDKAINLRAAPEYAKAWLYSGVDAVNTANNHAMDFHREGYEDTLTALDDYGIPHFGTLYPGNSSLEQDRLGVYDVKGIRVGCVAFSYPQDSDMPKIIARIKKLKNEEGCALVIVSLHWGREEQPSPESWQYTYARKIIDGGADVIWGHHPHVLQQTMFYKGKPIFFSTGNFTFGSMKKLDPDTGIFQLRYAVKDGVPELENFTVIPCRTQGKPDYRPILLTNDAERTAMFKKLINRKTVKNMDNLPPSFLTSGSVDIVLGELVDASGD